MRSILFSFGLLLACASHASHAADGPVPAMRYDHFNPVVLNEFALQKVRDGDMRSALVLLERAHLLAPHDARIRRNLEMLRAQREGRPFVESAAVDTAAVDTAAVDTAAVDTAAVDTPKSGTGASGTAATQVSGLEQLPLEPLWKKQEQ